jgi:hypothetical protein
VIYEWGRRRISRRPLDPFEGQAMRDEGQATSEQGITIVDGGIRD